MTVQYVIVKIVPITIVNAILVIALLVIVVKIKKQVAIQLPVF